MVTAKLLPIFVLGGLALLGCANQRQVPGNVTQASNQSLGKIDLVGYASDVAAVPGSSPVGDMASSAGQGPATQFVIPNPRQHVVSSGFPARDY
jgi:hypothetical protein